MRYFIKEWLNAICRCGIQTVLFIALCSIQIICNGQSKDSIDWVNQQADDTIKVNLLLRFSKSFRETDFARALELGKSARLLSQKLKFAKGIFKSDDNLSIIYVNKDQFENSLKLIRKMIALSDSIKNEDLLIKAKFRLARTYHFMGSDFKSIKIYLEILELRKLEGSESVARCNWEMADSYASMNDYYRSTEHLKRALEFYSKAKDHDAVMRIYISLGEVMEQQGNHIDAVDYFYRAMAVLKQHREIPYWTHQFGKINAHTANSFLRNGQTQTALYLYHEALKVFKSGPVSGSYYALSMVGMGEIYNKNRNYTQAIYCLESAITYYEEKKYYKTVLVNAYSKLIEAYESSRNFQKADANWKRLSIVKDSVNARQQKRELAELNVRYEIIQNEQQIIQLEKEKKFNIIILILLSGLVFVTFFFIWLFVSRQQINYIREKRELEMVAMRAQMNPHFIFNCLNSINDFIIKSERDLSSNYLGKFAKLIRYILNNSRTTFVTLEDELDALRLYLELEAMRFEGKFNYQVLIAQEIKSLEMEIPSMIVQPYIENSIWHGIQHLTGEGNLELNFKLNGKYLVCTIEDNGVGRPSSSNTTSSRKNGKMVEVHGTQIAQDRLNQMLKVGYLRAGVIVVDLKNRAGHSIGTIVELTLPIKLKREITPHL